MPAWDAATLNPIWLDDVVRRALAEDIGRGDLTSEAVIPPGAKATGRIVAKASGRIAGLAVAEHAFRSLAPEVVCVRLAADGRDVAPGDILLEVSGPARPILAAERVALNFLQRLSGIATATAQAVAAVAGTRARIVDTRKTTPGLRWLEKYAVRVGGGYNHRFGLDDAVLIKENHIAVSGGVGEAVRAAKAAVGHLIKVEVEVERLDQIPAALEAGADAILLDNMSTADMREAVRRIAGQAIVEASGGIGLERLREVAATGVDLISLGRLTHSAAALDLSLRLDLRA